MEHEKVVSAVLGEVKVSDRRSVRAFPFLLGFAYGVTAVPWGNPEVRQEVEVERLLASVALSEKNMPSGMRRDVKHALSVLRRG